MKRYITFAISILLINLTQAQTIEYLDINNVKATILNRGDMFWHPTTTLQGYEFPKNNGKHANFTSAIWMGGMDTNNVLHLAAQTYRQTGNDYWTGPLENDTDSITIAQSSLWDKIWKVNLSTIDSFKNITNHTVSNTPTSILEWPAIGNIYATGASGQNLQLNNVNDYAPFVDVNNDGIYNPLNGDYPKIKGQQALWWIFNDHGVTHSETEAIPLHIEIQAMAYACNNEALQNVTYYEYKIINRSKNTYNNMRIGIFNDCDLGYWNDDYIGFDSTNRMGICYNGKTTDSMFGGNLTQTGLKMIVSPSDTPNYVSPIGSFHHFYSNSPLPSNNTILFVNNALNAKWSDNSPIVKSCTGYGAGTVSNFCYGDDPSIIGGNSERQCANIPFDRRMIMSSNGFLFKPNEERRMVYAFINTPIGSSNADFGAIKSIAAFVQANGDACDMPLSIQNSQIINLIKIYPNPITSNCTIESELNIKNISITSIDGKILFLETLSLPVLKKSINLSHLVPGQYFIQITTSTSMVNKKMVIQ
jgi:hypothetical protein